MLLSLALTLIGVSASADADIREGESSTSVSTDAANLPAGGTATDVTDARTEGSADPDTQADAPTGAEGTNKSEDNTASGALADSTGVNSAGGADSGMHGSDADLPSTGGAGDSGADTAKGEGDKNPFMLLYGAICESAPVIMSALAAIASMILAFCYRKGLTPMLKDALGGMMSAVNSLKSGVSESDARAKEITDALGERLDAAEKAVARISELLDGVSRSDEGLCGISAVMSEQVELLYDLFMQSSLPEFKKERIGKRVAAMRAKLSAPEVESDDA